MPRSSAGTDAETTEQSTTGFGIEHHYGDYQTTSHIDHYQQIKSSTSYDYQWNHGNGSSQTGIGNISFSARVWPSVNEKILFSHQKNAPNRSKLPHANQHTLQRPTHPPQQVTSKSSVAPQSNRQGTAPVLPTSSNRTPTAAVSSVTKSATHKPTSNHTVKSMYNRKLILKL